MNEIQQAILKTLSYADVFEYPLTFQQLHLFLISRKKVSKIDLKKSLKSFHLVKNKGRFYYLRGRSKVVSVRIYREKESLYKMQEARKIAGIIEWFPFIQCIGLSGSVALKNCEKNHDIDLFIVTSPQTLWITRFFVMTVLFFLRKRRKPYDIRTQNKICANMFVTTENVRIPVSKRNLYTAHEVVQVLPLINKNKTYEYFLSQNDWVKKYLPNFKILDVGFVQQKSRFVFGFLDTLYFYSQRFYMRKKMTTEFIQKDAAFFHPTNYKKLTLNSYQTKYKQYQNAIKTNPKKARKITDSLRSKNTHLASIFTPGS